MKKKVVLKRIFHRDKLRVAIIFIYDFIIRLGYSAAYQNQMVSAIKIFHTIPGKGRVYPEFFERPIRRRALSKVFSKDEVTRILNSVIAIGTGVKNHAPAFAALLRGRLPLLAP